MTLDQPSLPQSVSLTTGPTNQLSEHLELMDLRLVLHLSAMQRLEDSDRTFKLTT